MPPLDPNRAGLLVFLLIIMLLTPESASPTQRLAFQEFLKVQRHRRDLLLNATFAEGPFDLEGIPNPILPEPVDSLARDLWSSHVPVAGDDGEGVEKEYSFYHNITGLMRGDWKRLDLGLNATQLPHSSEYVPREKTNSSSLLSPSQPVVWEATADTRNITGNEGILTIDISETKTGPIQFIEANMNIQDRHGENRHDIPMRGIHFADTGNIVLTTTSKKFAGVFSLPFLTLTEDRFNQSFIPLIQELNETVAELESIYEHDINPAYSGPTGSPDSCEYIVYIQIHSSELSREELAIIESELRFPKGQPHKAIPGVKLSSLVYSPNCGTVLESRSAVGEKIEKYWFRASNAAQIGALLTLLEIWLLIRQMNDTNTPSTVSKLSFWTVSMMSLVDGYLCMGYLTAAIFIESTFLPFMTVAFLSFLLVSVFGMRYLILIYRIQRPEHRATQPQPQAPPDSLPLPITSMPQTAQANIGAPSPPTITATAEDDGRGDVSLLYSRFYFVLLGVIFLTLNASTWPRPLRQIFQHTLFLVVNSYWVPQIYRNVMRGCRRAFKWEFVWGMSAIRLAPMLYLYLCEGNIIFHEVEPLWAMIITGWMWLQICTLIAQEILGPRFFVSEHLLPPSYDYHPALAMSMPQDLEAGTAGGDDQPTVSTDAHGGVVVMGSPDCAICMQHIDLPRLHHPDLGESSSSTSSSSSTVDGGIGSSTASALLARRTYMVTPCRHIFHTQCLESWMRFKLQCPTCRNALPPL
ncbi:uncharacterized protein V1518DRAFT_413740 [Limtongia smithiae]|uniref:uncharacterized protein n=1 Tax=Limtongia smithiae TaxID=1125753 RepID=UPI0034CDA41D